MLSIEGVLQVNQFHNILINLYIWNILIYFGKKQKWLVLFFGTLKC